MAQTQKFDRKFFGDFWRLLKPYWASEEKWIAIALLVSMIACIIIQVRANVEINQFFKDFFDAVQNFNVPVLIHSSIKFLILVTIAILAFGLTVYFGGLLTIRWRRWLTKNFMAHWLSHHNIYAMQVLHKNVDNPDQRISEDLESFPATSLSIFSNLLNSILTLGAFGYILWNLSGTLRIPIGATHHILIPGYMCFVTLIYAIVGTLLTVKIGKRLPGLNYQQQYFNADFRFGLVRVRESSEQIAFYRGEHVEDIKLKNLFTRIYDNYINIIKVQRNLTFFQNGYQLFSYLLSYLIGIPLYFAKKVQMGGIIQISIAFRYVLDAFSVFINSFIDIANWRAIIFRLTEFKEHINEARRSWIATPIDLHYSPNANLTVENLNLTLPNGTPLLNNLQLEVVPGDKLLITGPTGAGKSTLLRALAGIWPYGTGQILIPQQNVKTLFLPQKPYLPLGSLRDALAYPLPASSASEEECTAVLKLCGLEKFQSSLNTVHHWAHELSLGEQQLIAFARIFIQKPMWIFFDESTSALDEPTETKMYEILNQQLPFATVISVGHRTSLQQFHSRILEIPKIVNEIINSNSLIQDRI